MHDGRSGTEILVVESFANDVCYEKCDPPNKEVETVRGIVCVNETSERVDGNLQIVEHAGTEFIIPY
jgi:hypothetical protein